MLRILCACAIGLSLLSIDVVHHVVDDVATSNQLPGSSVDCTEHSSMPMPKIVTNAIYLPSISSAASDFSIVGVAAQRHTHATSFKSHSQPHSPFMIKSQSPVDAHAHARSMTSWSSNSAMSACRHRQYGHLSVNGGHRHDRLLRLCVHARGKGKQANRDGDGELDRYIARDVGRANSALYLTLSDEMELAHVMHRFLHHQWLPHTEPMLSSPVYLRLEIARNNRRYTEQNHPDTIPIARDETSQHFADVRDAFEVMLSNLKGRTDILESDRDAGMFGVHTPSKLILAYSNLWPEYYTSKQNKHIHHAYFTLDDDQDDGDADDHERHRYRKGDVPFFMLPDGHTSPLLADEQVRIDIGMQSHWDRCSRAFVTFAAQRVIARAAERKPIQMRNRDRSMPISTRTRSPFIRT